MSKYILAEGKVSHATPKGQGARAASRQSPVSPALNGENFPFFYKNKALEGFPVVIRIRCLCSDMDELLVSELSPETLAALQMHLRAKEEQDERPGENFGLSQAR